MNYAFLLANSDAPSLSDEYDTPASIQQLEYVIEDEFLSHLINVPFDEINQFHWQQIQGNNLMLKDCVASLD